MLLAQAVGGTNLDLVAVATQIGLSGIFLWLFLDATKERRAAQKSLETLFERLLPVLEEATSTLERVQAGMSTQVERVEREGPTPAEMIAALNRLENLSRELSVRLRNAGGDQGRRR